MSVKYHLHQQRSNWLKNMRASSKKFFSDAHFYPRYVLVYNICQSTVKESFHIPQQLLPITGLPKKLVK